MKEIKVDFTCPNCQMQFSLNPHDILKEDLIGCPHCSCSLSDHELADLKLAIRHMLNAN
ncbi:hypothetical protein [Desulfofalx alkaliphila]|uniref:hypothetical protein n=1 Tax=Desulfofalx alkaliphila TaxID=105483 RepID=UPI000AB4B5B1|nr:hypothetical protein [Desulfofalx alkaliphila]